MAKLLDKTGFVALVGAGPGNPGLVTVRAMQLLKDAEVVVYDYLANHALLEQARPDAERIYVGKRAGVYAMQQAKINELLVQKAKQGKNVIRLKGGDPFVFGRGGEEALALQAAGIPFEVVPGVTAGTAALAYAGIPATHRGLATAVSFITGHEDPAKPEPEINWQAVAGMHGTLVFYMGVINLEKITNKLKRFGKSGTTPVAVIRYGTLPIQCTLTGTLDTIVKEAQAAGLQPPALIVVGEVAALRKNLNWFENKPLFGKRIVVTRSRAQASDLVAGLESLGAEVLSFPTIKIIPPVSYKELDQAIKKVNDYAWVVFTSVNGVRIFFKRLAQMEKDVRAMVGVRLCAIGPATAARLRSFGMIADLQPQEFVAESLIEAFKGKNIAGQQILLPRADIARKNLRDGLTSLGALVHEVEAYRTVIDDYHTDETLSLIRSGAFDLVTFTSSATVKNFVALMGEQYLKPAFIKARTACIGPITAGTAHAFHLTTDIEAEQYTIAGLVEAIVRFYTCSKT